MKTRKTMEKEREAFAGLLASETIDREAVQAMYDDANADRLGLQECFNALIENVLEKCGGDVVKHCGSAAAIAGRRKLMNAAEAEKEV